MTHATDDTPRILATARIGGEFVRLLHSLAKPSAPRGKLLRQATTPDGCHLFSTAEMTTECVWWPAGTVADVLRALKMTAEAVPCVACRQTGRRADDNRCRRCNGAKYVPSSPTGFVITPAPATLPVEGDVAELWGWVRQLGQYQGKS